MTLTAERLPTRSAVRHSARRTIAWGLIIRVLMLSAITVVTFARSLTAVLREVQAGAPLAYLLIVPVWCGTVSFGRRFRSRERLTIQDRQLDWIVASAVGAFTWAAVTLFQDRLPGLDLLWRIDLLADTCWLWGGCVVLFGIRASSLHSPAWLLAAACWPAPYLLIEGRLGGTQSDQALLNLGLGLFAVCLALPGWRACGAALAVCSALGALGLALTGSLPWVFPVVVVPALAPLLSVLIVDVRRRQTRGPRIRPAARSTATSSRAREIRIARRGLLVSAFSLGFALLLPVADQPDWSTTGHVEAGTSPALPWASSVFGPGATLHRQKLGPATVDVLSGATQASLGLFPLPSYYAGLSADQLSSTTIDLSGGVRGSIYYNDGSVRLTPGGDYWIAVTWTTHDSRTAGTYQRITVLMPQLDGGTVPEPAAPTGSSLIARPLSTILRGGNGTIAEPPAPQLELAVALARSLRAQA